MVRHKKLAAAPVEWRSDNYSPGDPTWSVYGRLSFASDADETGVDRQLLDAADLARRKGATRILSYRDDGISAYNPRSVRPAFEMLIEDIAISPPGDFVVAWRAERLARRPYDGEALLKATGVDLTPIPRVVVLTVADLIDTSTAQGQDHFRDMIRFGRMESQAISQRVTRARKARIEQGAFTGSPPAFGHRDGSKWREVVPEEADAIRDAAKRVLAGQGVSSITRDWTARGIVTRTGKGWQHRAWIHMICAPRIAGIRLVRGAETRGDGTDGKPNIAEILDYETWTKVRLILLDPARRPIHPGGELRHLLTGLMRCGQPKCGGGRLIAKGQSSKTNGPNYWTYSCVRNAYRTESCGGIHIHGAKTDAHIEGIVLAALRQPGVRRAITKATSREDAMQDDEAPLRSELLDLVDKITAVEVSFMNETLDRDFSISPKSYIEWRKSAYSRRDELEKRISRTIRSRSIVRAIADPEAFWGHATLEERRDVISIVLPEIIVVRATSSRWNADRIKITALDA